MIDFSAKLKVFAGEFLANRVKFDVSVGEVLPLKSSTKAKAVMVAADENELVKAMDNAMILKIPVLVLGTGLKHKFRNDIKGLLIADKTRGMKIVGIKGKVGGKGIGVDEASVEIASGESISKVNQFLNEHGLERLIVEEDEAMTIGERLEWDTNLRSAIEKIKIWDQGQVYRCNLFEFNKSRHVIIGVIIKMKAQDGN
jgi:hypothetical protein